MVCITYHSDSVPQLSKLDFLEFERKTINNTITKHTRVLFNIKMTSIQGLNTIPGLLPPPGVTPNFVNPYNQNKITICLIAVCLPITTFFVFIRMYTKIRLIKSHAWEDCEFLLDAKSDLGHRTDFIHYRHIVPCLGKPLAFC